MGKNIADTPGICHVCALTAAEIWRRTVQNYGENKPKMPRQTNLQTLMYCFALSLYPHACALLASCCGNFVICTIMCACVPFPFRCVQTQDLQLSSAQKLQQHPLFMSNYMHVNIEYSNLALFCIGVTEQQTFMKHSFRTVSCGFRRSNHVCSAQNVLQSLLSFIVNDF